MDDALRTLCDAYMGLLKRAADEGYPIGVKGETTVEHALTDWEVAAALPSSAVDGPLTVGRVAQAREAINEALGAPIEAVSHRSGHETWAWRPAATSTGDVSESPSDHPSLFDGQPDDATAPEKAVA
jgi:hypothetical protein